MSKLGTIEVQLTLSEDAKTFLTALVAGMATATETVTEEVGDVKVTTITKEPAKKPASTKKPAAKKEEPAPEPEKEEETDPLDEGGADEQPTKDDVKKALGAYREIEGTDALVEVLQKFGASSLTELDEKHYADVIAAVK